MLLYAVEELKNGKHEIVDTWIEGTLITLKPEDRGNILVPFRIIEIDTTQDPTFWFDVLKTATLGRFYYDENWTLQEVEDWRSPLIVEVLG